MPLLLQSIADGLTVYYEHCTKHEDFNNSSIDYICTAFILGIGLNHIYEEILELPVWINDCTVFFGTSTGRNGAKRSGYQKILDAVSQKFKSFLVRQKAKFSLKIEMLPERTSAIKAVPVFG